MAMKVTFILFLKADTPEGFYHQREFQPKTEHLQTQASPKDVQTTYIHYAADTEI